MINSTETRDGVRVDISANDCQLTVNTKDSGYLVIGVDDDSVAIDEVVKRCYEWIGKNTLADLLCTDVADWSSRLRCCVYAVAHC